MEDRLLGFDVREMWRSPDDLWDTARRDTFLLREDVARPLSTDILVLPSVFDTGRMPWLSEQQRERLGLAGIATPSWIGPNTGLWEDLDAMRRYLAETWEAVANRIMHVAISWFSDSGFPSTSDHGPYPALTVPAVRDPAWELLGFDVSDGSLLSGLSNCGYSAAELPGLRSRWGVHINANHLFADVSQAFLFRESCDSRIPEHAPFFVYGLYRIEEPATP